MEKCLICKTELNKKSMKLDKVFDEKEKSRLEKIRKNRGYCSKCSLQMIILQVI